MAYCVLTSVVLHMSNFTPFPSPSSPCFGSIKVLLDPRFSPFPTVEATRSRLAADAKEAADAKKKAKMAKARKA